ncbi:MAG TPA: FAD-dependent oxidoreductase [Methylibium sp.]|uniref:FAD-dependent oxidoreductase n=1 Tax=Methylibium sp. TaxID=2067992 RepID=UPI002DB6B36B|nr:FAD-dependent oxidoreductase [Methylibium sp.]HEU4460070.1 FAD-dependent oxidoreductase [Methylibium sp.]
MRVGIAGAGLLGRLLAWRLANAGHAVQAFDPAADARAPAVGRIGPGAPPHAAAFTAAGMLSPLGELEHAAPGIAGLGWRSLARWREIASALQAPALLRMNGSLFVAHPGDAGTEQRVLGRVQAGAAALAPALRPQRLSADELAALEPALSPRLHAWHLPGEGQLLPRELLEALCAAAPSVRWHWNRRAEAVEPGALIVNGERLRFDLAIDTRGLGARDALPLRAVRGELLWLHAPGVPLGRPLRLVHPRLRVYLVPRPGDIVVVGASEIESEDRSPVSLRTALELMAAAHSVLPELAEARVVHMETNLRPALPDNAPRVHAECGLLRINGLFRHGWLVAPALVDDALEAIGDG